MATLTEMFSDGLGGGDPAQFHLLMCLGLFGIGVVTILALVFITAPYGRHGREGWGPTLPSRWAWFLMELPAVLCFLWWYLQGAHRGALVPLVCLGLWQIHYVHRTFVFTFRARLTGKRMPVVLILLAVFFNVYNAYINAHWVAHFGQYQTSWLWDPRFLCGLALFGFGLWLNISSDNRLMALRKPGETGYKVPMGGGFRYVSSPNYLGEFIEWCGWALLTWSWAGAAFAFYTAANLFPRAWANHRWYQETFPDYPQDRKAVLPFVL